MSLPKGAIGKAIVVFDYQGRSDSELTMKRGDFIWIYDKCQNNPAYAGWWLGELCTGLTSPIATGASEVKSSYGRRALFPKDYVNEIKLYRIDVSKVTSSIMQKQMEAGLLKPKGKENIQHNSNHVHEAPKSPTSQDHSTTQPAQVQKVEQSKDVVGNKENSSQPSVTQSHLNPNQKAENGLHPNSQSHLNPNKKKIGLSISSNTLIETLSNPTPTAPTSTPSASPAPSSTSVVQEIPELNHDDKSHSTENTKPNPHQLTHLRSAPMPKFKDLAASSTISSNPTESSSSSQTERKSIPEETEPAVPPHIPLRASLSSPSLPSVSSDSVPDSENSGGSASSDYQPSSPSSVTTEMTKIQYMPPSGSQPDMISTYSVSERDVLLQDSPLPSSKNRNCCDPSCVIL